MANILKIYPDISELTMIENSIRCTENDCAMVFTSRANLNMHLQKHHKRQNLKKTIDCVKQFYCPEKTCMHNNNSHFKKFNGLKQHYLKVHAEKIYTCLTCNIKFSTVANQKKHTQYCGVLFSCLGCKNNYSSYEALTTHGRRKKHQIPAMSAFIKSRNNESKKSRKKFRFVEIKPESDIQTAYINPVDVHVVNEDLLITKEIQAIIDINNSEFIHYVQPSSTQHTQTYFPRETTGTQTTKNHMLVQEIHDSKIAADNTSISMDVKTFVREYTVDSNTQTEINPYETKDDFPISFLEDQIMHSSSQTSLDFSFLDALGNCNSQTQTDLIFSDSFLQSSQFTSHIGSQTNEDNELDLYADMYTQTCSNMLMSDLEFNDIQTQTAWSDYDSFVSTETQTLLPQNMDANGRETNHMETQTEFQQMLEEINS